MNPPVRGLDHRDELAWLEQGVVDALAPTTRWTRSKRRPSRIRRALRHDPRERRSASCSTTSTRAPQLQRSSTSPAPAAALFGIVGKGRIAAGYDADFTIIDMKRVR